MTQLTKEQREVEAMKNIDDGGPAFPHEHYREAPQSGMTLRDY